jgi:hypothetical protein
MRLWTIHPKYLDRMGLVALWREGLLAQKVLLGKTRGYRNHPQLTRFREQPAPIDLIACYLSHVRAESERRGYRFDAARIAEFKPCSPIEETGSQLAYEWKLFLHKVMARDSGLYERLAGIELPECNPVFIIIPGPVREWEKVKNIFHK